MAQSIEIKRDAVLGAAPGTPQPKNSLPPAAPGHVQPKDPLPSTAPPTTTHQAGHAPVPRHHHHIEEPVDQVHHRHSRYAYGWNPDLPDPRDHVLVFDEKLPLPEKVDLRPFLDAHGIAVYDQGALSSCTANALAGLVEHVRARESLPPLTPSRLAIYYSQREKDGVVATDAGGQIRNGLKTLDRQGACDERDWPYEVPAVARDGTFASGSKALARPDPKLYRPALADRPLKYCRVLQLRDNMRCCLAQGYPFIAGFTVLDCFEHPELAASGVAEMPGPLAGKPIGGHAILVVGYDDSTHRFTCRNSWGPKWGDKGYFTMPYAYLCDADLAGDLWTIRTAQSSLTERA